MEKTTHIYIGGTEFHLTEMAYQKLSSYLESLKKHFAGKNDSDEIIKDIESRISEKLIEKNHSLIKEDDVMKIIAEIGEVSELDSESPENDTSDQTPQIPRKFYRDRDNAVLMGVASGLGAYFGVNPTYIRVAFVISIFFGGMGGIIYLLLTLFTPEAKTASQKLEMRGDPVNLDSISKIVRERIEENRDNKGIRKIFSRLEQLLSKIFRIFGKLIGILLSAFSLLTLLGISLGAVVSVTNWNTPYVSTDIHNIVSIPLLWGSILAGYLALSIPLIFILALGLKFIKGKSALRGSVGFGLLGIWFISIIASGAIGIRLLGDYHTYIETNPAYKEVSKTLEVSPFQAINAQGARVTIQDGLEQSVVINGTESNLNFTNVEVVDGVLTITTNKVIDSCILFCHRVEPSIVITTPDADKITTEGSNLHIENFKTPSLLLDIRNSNLNAELDTDTVTINATDSYVHGNIKSKDAALNGADSDFDLTGDVGTAQITMRRSLFSSRELVIDSADVNAINSRVSLYSNSQIKVTGDVSSFIDNKGPGTEVDQ